MVLQVIGDVNLHLYNIESLHSQGGIISSNSARLEQYIMDITIYCHLQFAQLVHHLSAHICHETEGQRERGSIHGDKNWKQWLNVQFQVSH